MHPSSLSRELMYMSGGNRASILLNQTGDPMSCTSPMVHTGPPRPLHNGAARVSGDAIAARGPAAPAVPHLWAPHPQGSHGQAPQGVCPPAQVARQTPPWPAAPALPPVPPLRRAAALRRRPTGRRCPPRRAAPPPPPSASAAPSAAAAATPSLQSASMLACTQQAACNLTVLNASGHGHASSLQVHRRHPGSLLQESEAVLTTPDRAAAGRCCCAPASAG